MDLNQNTDLNHGAGLGRDAGLAAAPGGVSVRLFFDGATFASPEVLE